MGPIRAAQMELAVHSGDFVVRLPNIVENAARMVLGNVGLLVKSSVIGAIYYK